MRLLVLILTLALLSLAVFGAEPAKLSEPFRSIVDLASTAPPEFAADALLRIVESGKLVDRTASRELAVRAFELAAAAKLPVRMMAVEGATTDMESGSLNQAYRLKLDVLSLQSRAVSDLLPLDPSKGRELFGRIVKPVLAPLTCDDALVYDPSDFYVALGAVANGAFTPAEKAKEMHVNLLLESLGLATSPSQIAPLASMIQSAAVTELQRQNLWTRLEAWEDNMQPDARSANAALPGLESAGFPALTASLRAKTHACAGEPKLDRYWQSTSAKQLLEKGKKLRGSPISTDDGQQQLAAYLNLISDWTQDSSESDAVFDHEKCIVYTLLLDVVPPGPLSDRILADFVDFVSNSRLFQESPAEWFVDPYTMLDRAKTNPPLRRKLLEAYKNSGNSVLVLEVALEDFSKDELR